MTKQAVQFDNVSYRYPGASRCAVEGVTLEVARGEMLAIVGPNGGGKSTLLALMLGLLDPSAGSVRVLNQSPSDVRRQGLIGVVPQTLGIESRFPVSVREVVQLAATRTLAPWKRATSTVRTSVDESLERTGVADLASQPIGRLSRGQLQRVLLARALAAGPKILALDEPLVGVDAPGRAQFTQLLSELHRDLGLTILLISHDLRTIAAGGSGCDRVACLNSTLHFHAAPSGITPEILAEVFHHDLADVFGDVHVDAHRADDCASDHPHAGKTGGADGSA